jgi:hypothetical protein
VEDEKGDWFFLDVNGDHIVPINYQEEKLPPPLQWKSSGEVRELIGPQGKPLLSIESADDAEVVKDACGKIIWPQTP